MLTKDEKLYIQYKDAYYNSTPLVSDDVFDALEEKIRKTNPNSSVLNSVGAVTDEYLVKHDVEMLSLQKTYDIVELNKWISSNDICYSYKMDGMAVSLIYNNGVLSAKTRGDGIYGKNITNNVSYMNLPNISINIEIRGEVVITKQNFEKLIEECKSLNLNPPTSMRNAVAGLLNPNKKHDIQLAKYLSFYAYDANIDNISYEENMFKHLEVLGFNTPYIGTYTNLQNTKGLSILNIIETYKNTKDKLEYLTDGLVFSINNRQVQKLLGTTSHHPRGKMAFKIQNEQGITTINSITYDVGKNGKISFVANVDPILLSGATIKNVTLHNAKFILDNDIQIGSEISIIRSGEVIPKFLSVVDNSKVEKQYELPKYCPMCFGELDWSDSEVDLVCNNLTCNGQILKGIIHWCKVLEIDGVSDGIISYLYDVGVIKNYKDIYKLTEADIRDHPGFGDTSAKNIITAINSKKAIESDKLLCALNINGIGKGTSKDIMKYFKTFDKFLNNIDNSDKLRSISGIGSKTIDVLISNSKYIIDEYNKLLKLGITIIDSYSITTQYNLSFCVTGTLSKNRNDIHKDIELAGCEVRSSVSKDLSYLVCNDASSNSSKVKNAIKHHVQIISEYQLYDMLNSFKGN